MIVLACYGCAALWFSVLLAMGIEDELDLFATGSQLKKLLSLLLASFSLVCGLLIAEIALRFLQPQPVEQIDNNLYTSETRPRYRLNPGYRGRISNLVEFDVSVSINSSGLRGKEVGKKSRAEPRLLILGDSFVFGWGVEAEETFAAQLARGLQTGLPGIQVLNGGVPGYGPVDMVDGLERFGDEFEPDMVLLALFIGNDLIDATEKHRQIDFAATAESRGFSAGIRDQLYRRSHLLRLVKRATPTGLSNRLRSWLGLPEPWATTYFRDLLESYAVEETQLAREGREASAEAFDRLVELSQEKGFSVVVTLMPGPLQILDNAWQQGLASLDAVSESYDPHRPAQVFRQLADERSWPVLDLTPAFRRRVDKGNEVLYFQFDPHWTAAGHGLAAKELVDFIVSETLMNASLVPSEAAVDDPVEQP